MQKWSKQAVTYSMVMNEKSSTCNLHNKTNISARPKNNEKQMIIDREKALVMSSKNTQSQLDSKVTGNITASQKYISEAKYALISVLRSPCSQYYS